MKRARPAAIFAPLLVSGLFSACATAELSETPPTFEEFEASTYREPWEGGVYIINGDTPVVDHKALREIYDQLYGGQGLIVHRAGGLDARWNETDKRNLTYCVSDAFGSRKQAIMDALRRATDQGWETFADVNFVHVTAEDASCTADNPRVLFDVRPVSGQPYLARAFFPNQPRSTRNVLVDSTAFDTIWPLENIMGHELGHALGFRHEHTRPEAGTCFEDSNWRPLTEYDSASVMHYPQCNGSANDLSFTELDAQGAAALYGPPGGEPPPPDPEPATHEEHFTGTLDGGEWRAFDAITVEPGSRFEAILDGSGDPDLYVRFGEAPTKAQYDCRPYLDTADELCAVDVPADATVAHVALHGFTPATFDLTLKWSGEDPGPGDPPDGPPELVINEILADPGAALDANRDGVPSSVDDEMVEVVNIGGTAIDLGGATISDSVAVRVVLPAITLEPGQALVVFGGGSPAPIAGVRIATGRLYLNNDADAVVIRDPGGSELASATYGAEAGFDEAIVRRTELDPDAVFIRHTELNGQRTTPGVRANGEPF